ncbi:MAG: hypothetical protein HFJ52_08620 [Clostridia bacterium]|nr:hypothetical protein [Clostridia bacterium]
MKNNIQKIIKKAILILVCFIISIISNMFTVGAVEDDTFCEDCITPASNQYIELRGTEIVDVDGNGKQLIMELWGHNLTFKRI